MKHFAILALMLSAVYVAAEVPMNGLIAAYTFNGTNPWRDVSGHGHDLKVVDPAFAPVVMSDPLRDPQNPDYRKSVVYYKPSDRRISALSATISSLPKGEETRTLIFYLYIPSLKKYDGTVLSYGTAQNVLAILDTHTVDYSIIPFDGKVLYSYYFKGYPSTDFSKYTTQKDYITLNDGLWGWTLGSVEYNNVTGIAIIQMGGRASSKAITCPTPEAIEPLLIGGGARGFTGYIDDIYIYNRTLTSDERNIIRLGNGTLDTPTGVTTIHPIQKKVLLNQTMYTVSGRKAQQTKGVTVSKGIAKVIIR